MFYFIICHSGLEWSIDGDLIVLDVDIIRLVALSGVVCQSVLAFTISATSFVSAHEHVSCMSFILFVTMYVFISQIIS